MDSAKKQLAIETLNRIMELELAGVVRYLHYSFLITATASSTTPATTTGSGTDCDDP